jgi:hypothetical protein
MAPTDDANGRRHDLASELKLLVAHPSPHSSASSTSVASSSDARNGPRSH